MATNGFPSGSTVPRCNPITGPFGTVYHDRREGKRAPYVDEGDLLLRIAARETAGELTQPVPYAMAVSIEVGVGSTIPVYDEVRAAVLSRVRPPVAT